MPRITRREFALSAAVAVTAERAAAEPAPKLAAPAINPAYLTGRPDGWPLQELAAAGYGALELSPEDLDRPAAWQGAADAAGLRVQCVSAMHSLWPYLTGSLSDAVEWRRRATLEGLKRALARMKLAGIPYLVVAPSRLAENYQSSDEARALLLGSLRELSDSAASATILLQAAPFRLFTSSVEIAALVDAAARPNIAAALDTGHCLLCREAPAAAANTLGARVRYVQVSDAIVRPGVPYLDRHLPLGEGDCKPEEAREAIGSRPWSVNVVAPEGPMEAARAALKWLRAG